MRTKLIKLLAVLGLIAGMVAGGGAPVVAAPDEPGQGALYFPWVPHQAKIAGFEEISGTITIQNTEIFPIDVTVTPLEGVTGSEASPRTMRLNPRASQTWTAGELRIEEPGAAVVATASWADPFAIAENAQFPVCKLHTVSNVPRGNGRQDSIQLMVPAERVVITALRIRSQEGSLWPSTSYTTHYYPDTRHLIIEWLADRLQPAAGARFTLEIVYDCPPPRIAGSAKLTGGTVGVTTSSDTLIVDGYSAVPAADLALAHQGGAGLEGQSRWVLPIVQTNSGWNTVVFITNVADEPTSVNAAFYPAGGQGIGGRGKAILTGKVLEPGQSTIVDLTVDAKLAAEQVGTIWIDASHAVVAMAVRAKPSTAMMLTTVAQPRTDSASWAKVRYGPLVFRDYNGWNTGINIANLSSETNQVTVTLYNYDGNVVGVESIKILARAMEYIYMPATGEIGLGDSQISSAVIVGTGPLAAAIDEVKYTGGQGQGHAMSYPAASPVHASSVHKPDQDQNPVYDSGRYHYEAALALPLVQKGDPDLGTGDTSGVNLFNSSGCAPIRAWVQFVSPTGVPSAPTVSATDAEAPIRAWVQFVSPTGVPSAPTVSATDAEAPMILDLPPHAGATLYTLGYSEMLDGFAGSAVIGVESMEKGSSKGCADAGLNTLVGVSNNVNYHVAGDGSAVFNLNRIDPLGDQDPTT